MSTRKLKYFKIILDDENLLFFPGAFLTGKVVLEIDDDLPILALFFHIVGEGVVRLVGSGGLITQDKENYIDFRMKLLGDNLQRVGMYSVSSSFSSSHLFCFCFVKNRH